MRREAYLLLGGTAIAAYVLGDWFALVVRSDLLYGGVRHPLGLVLALALVAIACLRAPASDDGWLWMPATVLFAFTCGGMVHLLGLPMLPYRRTWIGVWALSIPAALLAALPLEAERRARLLSQLVILVVTSLLTLAWLRSVDHLTVSFTDGVVEALIVVPLSGLAVLVLLLGGRLGGTPLVRWTTESFTGSLAPTLTGVLIGTIILQLDSLTWGMAPWTRSTVEILRVLTLTGLVVIALGRLPAPPTGARSLTPGILSEQE